MLLWKILHSKQSLITLRVASCLPTVSPSQRYPSAAAPGGPHEPGGALVGLPGHLHLEEARDLGMQLDGGLIRAQSLHLGQGDVTMVQLSGSLLLDVCCYLLRLYRSKNLVVLTNLQSMNPVYPVRAWSQGSRHRS